MADRKSREQLRKSVMNHFDSLADQYDGYKKHSWYYYSQLKALLFEIIPEHAKLRILEVGCGTGTLLAEMAPVQGLGVDISQRMISIARQRWISRPELEFLPGEAETLEVTGEWDVVIMCDVLEHLYHPEQAIARLAEILTPGTRCILTWANSIWEPVLYILEKLHLKMPEGDHNWESRRAVLGYLKRHRFHIIEEGTRCIIPADLPAAGWINRSFHGVPGLKRLGLIRYIHAQLSA